MVLDDIRAEIWAKYIELMLINQKLVKHSEQIVDIMVQNETLAMSNHAFISELKETHLDYYDNRNTMGFLELGLRDEFSCLYIHQN